MRNWCHQSDWILHPSLIARESVLSESELPASQVNHHLPALNVDEQIKNWIFPQSTGIVICGDLLPINLLNLIGPTMKYMLLSRIKFLEW